MRTDGFSLVDAAIAGAVLFVLTTFVAQLSKYLRFVALYVLRWSVAWIVVNSIAHLIVSTPAAKIACDALREWGEGSFALLTGSIVRVATGSATSEQKPNEL